MQDATSTPDGHVPVADYEKVSAERERYRKLYLEAIERCAMLERGIIAGKKAERFDGETPQLALSMLDMLLGEPATEGPKPTPPPETSPVREHERRSPGRRPLPEHLPRVEIEILPPEVQQAGLDAYKRIGQEVQEVLERRPASMVVVRLVRPKFIRKDELDALETRVVIAAAPERPIDRGLAGPGMLAMTIVHRWQDAQPLYR